MGDDAARPAARLAELEAERAALAAQCAALAAERAELAAQCAALAASERRLREVFTASPVGIGLADEHGRFTEVNPAMGRLLGRAPEEMVGRLGAEFVHPDDLALHGRAEQDQQESPDGVIKVEARHLLPDGTARWLELVITAVPGPNGEHWTFSYAQDVTDRKADEAALRASRAELEALASTDPMTGALNRRAWDAALARIVEDARRTGRPLALALLDLDHFKRYNDEFGHTAGDALLREFAGNARRCLRAGDVFARWGGEEFVAALPGCTAEQAEPILHRVRTSVPHGRTCSVGIATWRPGEPLAATVARADAALYDAKRAGRDRVRLAG